MKIMNYLAKYKAMIGASVLALSLILTAGVVTFSTAPEEADAGVPWFVSQVVVSNPKPPSVRKYQPGESLNFRADFIWTYCSNEGGGQIFGRITRPVAVDKNHTGFGSWRGANEGQQVNAGPQRIGSRRGGERVRLNRPPVTIYKPRAAIYTQPLSLPTRPGRYHFKYEVQIRTPQGNISRTGRVVFEIAERETSCTANQIELTRNGTVVCVPKTLDLTCTGSATSVDVGESVSFTATASDVANFTWYNGSGTGGAVIAGPESGTQSVLTRSYSTPGVYQVTAVAQNANGYGICTRGVTVGDVPEDDQDVEEVVDEFGNVMTQDTLTLTDGTVITLDPSALSATITFELDKTITNTTCGATWTAQNVAQCYLVQNENVTDAPAVGPIGTDDVIPATYRVKCVALKDGSIVSSEARLCRKNPNIGEI